MYLSSLIIGLWKEFIMKVQPTKCGVYVLSGLGAVMVFFLLLLKNSAFFLEEEYDQNNLKLRLRSTNIPITFTKALLTGQTAVQQQKKK